MSKGLSEAQRVVLCLAITSGSRIFCYGKGDRTLSALGRKGFAKFENGIGRKYSQSHWWITDAGMDAGRAALAPPVKEG